MYMIILRFIYFITFVIKSLYILLRFDSDFYDFVQIFKIIYECIMILLRLFAFAKILI